MRTRTLFLLDQLNLAGAQKRAFNIARSLDPDRFEVQIICLQAGGPLADPIRNAGIDLTILEFDPSPRRIFHNLIQLFHLFSILKERKPAIVHSFFYWSTVYGSIASRLAGVPIMITSRTSLYDLKPKGALFRLIELATNPLATAVVTISKAVRRDTIELEGVPDRKVEFVYNGVELPTPNPAAIDPLRRELGLDPADPVIVMVANFHRYKRHETVLRAIPEVLSAHPTTKFLMVGRESGEIENLRRVAEDTGIANSVRFTGVRMDIPEILELADIGILCSETEALGNAALEYMAAGLPVIGTRVGGLPEIIEDDKTGFIIDVGDADELAKHLVTLLGDSVRRAQMGAAGRAKAEREFSLAAMVDGYTRVYESKLRGSATP